MKKVCVILLIITGVLSACYSNDSKRADHGFEEKSADDTTDHFPEAINHFDMIPYMMITQILSICIVMKCLKESSHRFGIILKMT